MLRTTIINLIEYLIDMPLIYYVEGHSLHFGRLEYALITGMRFGTIRFCLYTSADLKFRNRVFPNKVGLVITNLDVLGVIDGEVMFGNLCDKDSDSKTNTDIRPTRAEYQSSWWIESNVFLTSRSQASRNRTSPPFQAYISKLEKLRKRLASSFRESSSVCTRDNRLKTRRLTDRVIRELNVRVFKLETIIQVLALERNDKLGRLQFNEDLSRLRGDFVESLNILFQDLVDPHDSVEDIANEYLVDEELKLCLEEEERIRSEQEKRIQQEKRLRLEEEKMLRLEEEKMLQIAEVNKRKRYEFMNSTHVKNILGNFPPIKRNDAHSVTCKAKPKESWVKIKKYRQNVNDPSLAELLKKVKPWVELPCFTANGDKYGHSMRVDVDRFLFPLMKRISIGVLPT
ncbi:hypothetical protein Tco_0024077 [Tanacetum coccineum]